MKKTKPRTIVQYGLELTNEVQTLAMRQGGRILAVGQRGDQPSVWAIEEDGAPVKLRNIQLVANGGAVLDFTGEDYLGTVSGPGYCFHAFEVTK